MGCGIAININKFIQRIEKGAVNGVAPLDNEGKILKLQIPELTALDVGAIASESDPTVPALAKTLSTNDAVLSAVNAATGLISASRLPSYVDDVLSYPNLGDLPATGEAGKIYVVESDGKIYRWSGSSYLEISPTAGNADTATRLATARTISITGDGSASVNFDGSANVSGGLTLASVNGTPGNFGSTTQTPVITVDEKGRITLVSNATITPSWGSISGLPANISFIANSANNPPNWHTYVLSRVYGAEASWIAATINSSLENTLVQRSSNGSITGFNLTANNEVLVSGATQSTSTTTGALRVPNGGASIGGDLNTGGFSSFGGSSSGHPGIKIKRVTGTTGATQGSLSSVAHGLSVSKIIAVLCSTCYSGNGFLQSNSYTRDAGYQFDWSTDSTNINLILHPTNSANILSKPFESLIFYIA